MKIKKTLILTTMGLLTGCSTASISQYKNENPVLRLEDYFNGTLEAQGMFQDRSGLVVKRFHVVMKATWKDGVGVLNEDFTYADGTKSQRVWTLKNIGNNKYTGTAPDVVGTAHGEVAGNAFHWRYTLNLPVGGKSYEVSFDDWMYLMDSQIMLNRSSMSKFGIYLGEVTLAFIKKAP